MKRMFMILGVGLLTFTSCSKEETPTKQHDPFIFFKLVTMSDSIIEVGYTNGGSLIGPSIIPQVKGDSIYVSIFHNPSGGSGFISPRLDLRKKGNSIVGKYFYQESADPVSSYMSRPSPSLVYRFNQESLIVDIHNVGTHSSYGKYVEGSLTGKVFKDNDTTTEIPAWGTFRVKYN